MKIQSFLFFLILAISISGCLGKKQLDVKFKDPSAFNTTTGNVNISTVAVVSNQLIIRGSGLKDITSVKLSEGGVDQTLTVESATAGEIIANGVSTVNIGVGKVFDMILSDANGAATFPVSFSLTNGTVTAAMLSSMGATPGQVLKYTSSGWLPTSQTETQAFIGTWDATTTIPDITATVPGDYYVVSVAFGTYAVGDWIISDGYSWSKLAYSKTSVSSFQNRKGIVTLVPADYLSLKAATTPFKIPGSSLKDLADVDLPTTPLDGQVLKWDTDHWEAGTAASSTSISLTSLSATAPLSYNNTTGVFSLATADLLATPLTNLASGSGAVIPADTLLGAFGKLMAVPSDYVSKSSTGSMTLSGSLNLTGPASYISVPTAFILAQTDVTNVEYVTNAIAGNGAWAKGSGGSAGTINFSTGNVGIGTTTPTRSLTVSGSTLVTGGTDATSLQIVTGIAAGLTANQASVRINGSSPVINTVNGGTVYFNRDISNGFVSFQNNGTSLVDILPSGNVGIGTTIPVSKLHIGSAPTASANYGLLSIGPGAFDGSTGGFFVGSSNGTGYAMNAASGYTGNLVDLQTAGASRFKVDSSGNLTTAGTLTVGAGTFSNSGNNTGIPGHSIPTFSSGIRGSRGTVYGMDGINSVAGTGLSLFSNSIQSLSINNLGNVGIAITTPASKLHVGAAPTASANYGLLSLGSGAFDGVTAGYFGTSSSSNSSGTVIAINAALGYVGDLVNFQLAGDSKFKVDASGNLTLAGTNSTAPGQVGQTPTSSSLLVKSQGDALYGATYKLIIAADQTASGTTLTDSTESVTIPAGTYMLQGYAYATTASTTGGSAIQMSSTATATMTQINNLKTSSNTANAASLGTPASWGNLALNVAIACNADAPAKTCTSTSSGIFTITTPSTFNLKFGQRSVLDAINLVTLKAGSFVIFRSIPN